MFVSHIVCLHQCVYVHVHVYLHVMHACSELLLGVVAPRLEVLLVYAYYV